MKLFFIQKKKNTDQKKIKKAMNLKKESKGGDLYMPVPKFEPLAFVKHLNCAVQILWLVINNLCAE